MHGGVVDVAEWLGYEVVENEVAGFTLRYRRQGGKWAARDQAATAAEQHLYAAVRTLVMTPTAASDVAMRVISKALGLDTSLDGVSIKAMLDSIADWLARERKYREAYEKAEELVNALRTELIDTQAKVQSLLVVPRVGPKGGDRGELARQVRRTAGRISTGAEHPPSREFGQGVTAMANTVLHLLGEPPLHHVAGQTAELLRTEAQRLLQAVQQLAADHVARHDEGTRAFYLNRGEQTAYTNVVKLLENGSCGRVTL